MDFLVLFRFLWISGYYLKEGRYCFLGHTGVFCCLGFSYFIDKYLISGREDGWQGRVMAGKGWKRGISGIFLHLEPYLHILQLVSRYL